MVFQKFFLYAMEIVNHLHYQIETAKEKRLLSDIVTKGLPKGVLSKHLRFVWLVERSAWIKELYCNTAPQYYQTWE